MRLGIFGGSFDPVHNGHLTLAACCQQQARLDEVWFTPAAHQPLKPRGPQAGDEDRCRMIQLAIEDRPGFRLCREEIDRGGVSYTVDTLGTIHARHPDAEIYFLLGADALDDLPQWHKPEEICRLATPLVVHRAGEPPPDLASLAPLLPDKRPEEIDQLLVEMPAMPISSSEIRRRVAAGEPIDRDVPRKVAELIASLGLYQATST